MSILYGLTEEESQMKASSSIPQENRLQTLWTPGDNRNIDDRDFRDPKSDLLVGKLLEFSGYQRRDTKKTGQYDR